MIHRTLLQYLRLCNILSMTTIFDRNKLSTMYRDRLNFQPKKIIKVWLSRLDHSARSLPLCSQLCLLARLACMIYHT